MHLWLIVGCVILAIAGSLLFGTLTYSLREFSRVKLEAMLEKTQQPHWLEATLEKAADLAFLTAVMRLFSNILVLIGILRLLANTDLQLSVQYLLAVLITGAMSVFLSVAVPHALARHAPEANIAYTMPLLHGLYALLWPAVKIMHLIDAFVGKLAGPEDEPTEALEQEIMSVVEEGEEQGVMDGQERQMIKSVIEFRDTTAGEIMTARPDIIGVDVNASLEEVKDILEASGHSRIPVYEQDMDHVVGVLYARDLLQYLGEPPGKFTTRATLRPPIFVPATKPLRDLLREFRHQKVHIAIVLDEYGGTAGLLTIEDILEELVGEITDEHEPTEPAMLKRLDDVTSETDARIFVSEVNRLLGLSLPEDAGYETLGGFVTSVAGKIPPTGTQLEQGGVKFTILDAEPQRVNRIRIQLPVTNASVQSEGTAN